MSSRWRVLVVLGLVVAAAPGHAVVAGNPYPLVDFNGDGFGDLAFGAPRADVDGVQDAGAVHVLYGTPDGLSSTGDQRWHQGRLEAIDGLKLEARDRFGSAIAVGDYNGDGFSDLAIGAPLEDHDGNAGAATTVRTDAGVVHLLYGSEDGLSADGALTILNRSAPGNPDITGERFGAALVRMDRYRELAVPPNGPDPFDDLVIGAPGDATQRGMVHIRSMDADGLGGSGSTFTCPDGGVGDGCGSVLAAGRITEWSFDGLAVGAPGATVDGKAGAGLVVLLLPYRETDLTFGYGSRVSVDADDVLGLSSQAGAAFGSALAIENVVGGVVKELFIGVPRHDLTIAKQVVADAGVVVQAAGTDDGPGTAVAFGQSAGGVPGDVGSGHRFGSAIVWAGSAPLGVLAIGVPGATVNGKANAGAIALLYASDELTDRLLHLDRAGMAGTAKADDRLGQVLHRMKLLGTEYDDLVIGVPLADVGTLADAGAVHVIPGGPTGLTGDGDQRWTLDSSGVNGEPGPGDRLGTSLD